MAYTKKNLKLEDYRMIIDGLDAPILAVDSNGTIIFANQKFIDKFIGKKRIKVDLNFLNIFSKESCHDIIRSLKNSSIADGVKLVPTKTKYRNQIFKTSCYKTTTKTFGPLYVISDFVHSDELENDRLKMEDYIGYITDLGEVNSVYGEDLLRESLSNFGDNLVTNKSLQKTLNKIARNICVILDGKGALIWIKYLDSLRVCGQYGMSKSYIGDPELDIKINQGITGKYFEKKKSQVFNNLSDNPLLYHKKLPQVENVDCMIMIPISYSSESVGAINVFKKDSCSLSRTNSLIVKSYGIYAANILKNVFLIEELYRLSKEYEAMIIDSLDSTKKMFVRPISAMINHEVKNILNIFKMQINEIVEDKTIMRKLSKTKQTELKKVNKKLDLSVDVTKSLSEFFAITANKESDSEFNVYDVISKAVTFLSTKLDEPRIAIDTDEIDRNIYIYGNYMELLLIIFNLLNNSIKAIQKTKKSIDPIGTIKIVVKKHLNYILISVEDTGIGIPNEHKKSIFTAGFTTDRQLNSKSSGIGLFGSQKIIEEEYKGTLSFVSKVGKGSTFTISIPA